MDQKKSLQKVVFLDRDGVINRDSPDYIKNWSEFEFLPRSIEAIKRLTLNGFTTIVISNQSAINRKLTSRKDVEHIHAMLKNTVKSRGGEIQDIFFCPHTPEERCNCRKPKPGLIYTAQKTHRIDLASSTMVGDSAKDIECAKNAGCGHAVLVKTGNGTRVEKFLTENKVSPDLIAPDLYEAVSWIIERS